MPDSCAALKETHQPQVLVETAGLSEKEWLAYRRKGIGGSDVAALLGISPWRTARDLYYDKLNIAAVEDNEENWVALEMGHLLEPLVAKIFQHRTGYKIYQVKKMFQHPKYPWMLADVDYFVELPDGTTAILEIKTTNYNAKDHWWLNGEETVPVYYETQGRHYMAVMNVDRCFFCCLYGNNEEETIIREIRRDEAYEDEMIFLEQHFWENYVLAKTPPPYTEEGNLVIESVRRHTGPADKDAPVVTFDYSLTAKLMRYLQLQEEKKHAEKNSKEIDADMQRLKGALIAEMGKSCKAICQQDGVNYTVTYNPVRKPNQTSKDKPGEHQDKQYRKQKQNDDDGDDLADVLAPGPNGPGHGTIRAAGGSSFCGTGNCLACFNSAFYGVGSGCSGFHGIGKTSLFFFTHLDLVLSAGSGGQLLDD